MQRFIYCLDEKELFLWGKWFKESFHHRNKNAENTLRRSSVITRIQTFPSAAIKTTVGTRWTLLVNVASVYKSNMTSACGGGDWTLSRCLSWGKSLQALVSSSRIYWAILPFTLFDWWAVVTCAVMAPISYWGRRGMYAILLPPMWYTCMGTIARRAFIRLSRLLWINLF